MPYFSEEINGKMKMYCKLKVNVDNCDGEAKEEDFRLPLTLAW
jgi:hypothetical protein